MKVIRTGTGQPEITCQNLGCYHAGSGRLNRRWDWFAVRAGCGMRNLAAVERNKIRRFFHRSKREKQDKRKTAHTCECYRFLKGAPLLNFLLLEVKPAANPAGVVV